jgi:predicted DNA binding CopG/RHH family protein
MKKIPEFKNEDKEREFWESHGSTDYVDWSKGKRVRFSELKPSEKSISLRIPGFLVEDLKFLANRQGVPYQSLLKTYLVEKVKQELSLTRRG